MGTWEGKPPDHGGEETDPRGDLPDGVGPNDDYPRTIEGKLMEMRDIGISLLEIQDSILRLDRERKRQHAELAMQQQQISVDMSEVWQMALTKHLMKLTSMVALQTECIEQMYRELRGPGL